MRLIEAKVRPLNVMGPVATTTSEQFVWGLTYVNDLIERDDTNSSGGLGVSGSGLGERLFAVRDENHNVVAVANSSGVATERFQYDPYGAKAVLNALTYVSISDLYGTVGGIGNVWNVGFQGGVDQPLPNGVNTTLIQFNSRVYSADLGRWIQKDPAGYVDGLNAYQSVSSDPVGLFDPYGLASYREGAGDPKINSDPGAGQWGSEQSALYMETLRNLILAKPSSATLPNAFANLLNITWTTPERTRISIFKTC